MFASRVSPRISSQNFATNITGFSRQVNVLRVTEGGEGVDPIFVDQYDRLNDSEITGRDDSHAGSCRHSRKSYPPTPPFLLPFFHLFLASSCGCFLLLLHSDIIGLPNRRTHSREKSLSTNVFAMFNLSTDRERESEECIKIYETREGT